MNRIVREHYPVTRLPEDLREGLAANADVRVTVEWAEPEVAEPLSLDQLFAMRKAPFRSTQEIVEEMRRRRDEWHD